MALLGGCGFRCARPAQAMRRCVLCAGRVRTAARHASLRPAHSLRSRSCLYVLCRAQQRTNKQRCAALLPRCCRVAAALLRDRCSHFPHAAAAARGRARDARLHCAATNGQTHDIRCAACMHACTHRAPCAAPQGHEEEFVMRERAKARADRESVHLSIRCDRPPSRAPPLLRSHCLSQPVPRRRLQRNTFSASPLALRCARWSPGRAESAADRASLLG